MLFLNACYESLLHDMWPLFLRLHFGYNETTYAPLAFASTLISTITVTLALALALILALTPTPPLTSSPSLLTHQPSPSPSPSPPRPAPSPSRHGLYHQLCNHTMHAPHSHACMHPVHSWTRVYTYVAQVALYPRLHAAVGGALPALPPGPLAPGPLALWRKICPCRPACHGESRGAGIESCR